MIFSNKPIHNKIETPEGDRHPYLKKSFWKNPNNHYWKNPAINYNPEFIESMESFVERVQELDGGCFLRLIPDN